MLKTPQVNPVTMVSSLYNLDSLTLAKTSLSSQQLEILCSAWTRSTPSLKHLDLSNNDLSSVPVKYLADIALQMESLNVRHVKLTADQANDLCTAVGHSRKLNSFDLSHNNLSHVNWLVIQRLVAKVENAVLDLTELTHTLTWRLFQGPSSRIKSLSIAGVDLSAVEADHFGKMIAQLEEANLEGTKLTPEQTVAIFTSLDGPSSSLHTLNIGANRLSRVAPDLMARVVNKMKVVNLDMTVSTVPTGQIIYPNWPLQSIPPIIERLSFEQMEAILTKSLEGTLLTYLRIGPVSNEERLKQVIDKAANAIRDLIIVKESKW